MSKKATQYIFVSRPTRIEDPFEAAYKKFHKFLDAAGLSPRRLGQSDYSRKAPLRAVMEIIDNCCGAIILGYPQIRLKHEVQRGGDAPSVLGHVFPTPWNQIEGALAFRAETPVLVIAHVGVSGGVFDHGVTGEAVLHADLADPRWFMADKFRQPFGEWKADCTACPRPKHA